MEDISRRKFIQLAGTAALSAAALASFGCSAPSSTVNAVRSASVGDVVEFGSYKQVAVGSAGADPIEWTVVATNGDHRMLVSRYALAAKAYNDADAHVTWEACTLRTWLNGEFYEAAFTSAEKAAIQESALTTANYQGYPSSTYPDIQTQDKVFLLSLDEVDSVLRDGSVRKCRCTAATAAEGLRNNDGYCSWWLRDLGVMAGWALVVDSGGDFSYSGSIQGVSSTAGVRPALWV